MKILEYEIKMNPDPENPNEQPSGVEIWDDRLYGEIVSMVFKDGQGYNRAFFSKNQQSNKLTTSQLQFNNGDIITLMLL